MFKWLGGGEAAEVGTALADDFVLQSRFRTGCAARREKRGTQLQGAAEFLQKFLLRVDHETRASEAQYLKARDARQLLQVAIAREGR